MRRGGGSRGGGFRGGGSRGFSSSSRRHFNHRHHYRRGYYGSYGYHRRGNPLVGLVVFLLFFSLMIPFVPAAIFSSADNYDFTLGPNQTRYLNHGTFDSDVSVQVIGSEVSILVFDEEPILSRDIPRSENITNEPLEIESYTYFEFYLNKGSVVSTTWSSNLAISFYVIESASSFSSWEDGSDNSEASDYGQSGSLTFTTDDSDAYFFAFENNNFQVTQLSVNFSITAKAHDVSNPLQAFEGSSVLSSADLQGDALVFYNSGNAESQIQVVVDPLIPFSITYLVFLVLMIGGTTYLIKRYRQRKKRRVDSRNKMYPRRQATYGVTSDTRTRVSTDTQSTKQSEYVSRPEPIFCGSCGAGVLPNAKFCTECGSIIK